MTSHNCENVANISEIMQLIPHRPPMLLVDRVEQIIPLQSAVGIKNVTMNEWFFIGHFPDHPVMPGVLIVEAMAQTAGVLVMKSLGSGIQKQNIYFMSIDKAKFRKPVSPGDTLRMVINKQHGHGKMWRFQGYSYVGDDIVAEAFCTAIISTL